MNSQHKHKELLQLASDQCHGALDKAAWQRLESLLADDPDARRVYLQYMFLHAHLAISDEAVLAHPPAEKIEAAARQPTAVPADGTVVVERATAGAGPRDWLHQPAGLAVMAACILLPVVVVVTSFWLWDLRPATAPPGVADKNLPSPASQERSPAVSVATLTESDEVEWVETGGKITAGQELRPGTLRLKQGSASIAFNGGAKVVVSGPTTLGMETEKSGSLFSGRLWARLDRPNADFALQTRGLRVVDLGTEFGVYVNGNGETEVHCFDGEVVTQSRVRLPRFFWNFDDAGDQVVDQVGRRPAQFGGGVQRVKGLVGSGAVSFNNTHSASVNVGNGGGTRLGSGDFGITSGITVEAIIVPAWSGNGKSNGKYLDYDEIFRKEDGVHRILLSFQNDDGAQQRTIPPIQHDQPTLSFGLHLAGDGYSELEVVLDGQDGRPTLEQLKDGRPHHVVATYDSWTGTKALYIDGVLQQSARFPAGTLIICGGPTDAMIGNMKSSVEPFQGVIDEVAIYDFALTAEEITSHWQNVQQGDNYFGVPAEKLSHQVVWQTNTNLKAGSAMRFDADSGLALGEVPLDRQRFRWP